MTLDEKIAKEDRHRFLLASALTCFTNFTDALSTHAGIQIAKNGSHSFSELGPGTRAFLDSFGTDGLYYSALLGSALMCASAYAINKKTERPCKIEWGTLMLYALTGIFTYTSASNTYQVLTSV